MKHFELLINALAALVGVMMGCLVARMLEWWW